MEVQYDNPYEVGMTGLLGMPSGYYSMHEAEVLVMLGTDFPYSAFLPDDIKIAQIDIKAERLGRRCQSRYRLMWRCKINTTSTSADVTTEKGRLIPVKATETV